MANFVGCLAILLYLLSILFALGAGPVLLLQPMSVWGRSLKTPLLLSPLVGVILLYAVGLTKISCMLPLGPLYSTGVLLVFSLALSCAGWRRFRRLDKSSRRDYLVVLAPVVCFLFYFAFIFHVSGFELLSGSQDEYQYCSDATHMLLYQNLGGPNDIPIPRIDHWLYDWMTRVLCYIRTERHDQLLLASTMALTSLSAPESFPVVCGVMITILILTAGTLSECLKLDTKRVLLLQFGLVALFYLPVLHLQGSLANLSSIPCYFAAAAWLVFGLDKDATWRDTIMLGVFIGGSVLLYPDAATFGVLIPLLIVATEAFIKRRASRLTLLKRLAGVIAITALISTQSLSTVVPKIFYNVNHLDVAPGTASLWEVIRYPIAFDLGICSCYDDGPIERWIYAHTIDQPAALITIAIVLYAVASFGIFRAGRNFRGFQITLLLLMIVFGISILRVDAFRASRAFGYSLPYMFIGLVLATTQSKLKIMTVLSGCVLALFLGINVLTQARMTRHIVTNNLHTDKLIRRLAPNSYDWRTLRSELSKYPKAPVLISGFRDTPSPHRLVSAIEPHPHVVGATITSFWNVQQSSRDYLREYESKFSYLNHRIPLEELATWSWERDYPAMILQSRQALVPTGANYPAEWAQWEDILPAYRTRYTNVCDVVYKLRTAILEDCALGPLCKDKVGGFRLLVGSWRPRLYDDRFAVYVLTITFEGAPSNLTISGIDPGMPPAKTSRTATGEIVVEIPLQSGNFGRLELTPVQKPLKLRKLELIEYKLE